MIFESRYPPIAPSNLTITQRFFQGLENRPDDIAIVDGATGREVTAATVIDRIRRFAGGLIEHGGELLIVLFEKRQPRLSDDPLVRDAEVVPRRSPRRLKHGEQHRHEHADHRERDQHLHQTEAATEISALPRVRSPAR